MSIPHRPRCPRCDDPDQYCTHPVMPLDPKRVREVLHMTGGSTMPHDVSGTALLWRKMLHALETFSSLVVVRQFLGIVLAVVFGLCYGLATASWVKWRENQWAEGWPMILLHGRSTLASLGALLLGYWYGRCSHFFGGAASFLSRLFLVVGIIFFCDLFDPTVLFIALALGMSGYMGWMDQEDIRDSRREARSRSLSNL